MNTPLEKKDLLLSEKQKERLFPVVLDLFSKKDFHQVNMREISKISGMSTTTLYRYFASKEDLLFTVLEEKISEIVVITNIHVQGIESTKEIFRKIFWVTMDYYDQNPGVAVAAFITVPMRAWIKERSSYTYIKDDVKKVISDAVAHGHKRDKLDPLLDIRQYIDLYYMYCYRQIHLWYFHGMKWKLVESIPKFFDVFWKTISMPEVRE